MFVYEARFADPRLAERETHEIRIDDGSTAVGLWRAADALDVATSPLYPDGLLELVLEAIAVERADQDSS